MYDSCRDDPKDFIKRKLEQSKQSSGYIMKNSPNLVIGYGTMPNMKAYEENDIRTGVHVGVYMKHLLNHIRSLGWNLIFLTILNFKLSYIYANYMN